MEHYTYNHISFSSYKWDVDFMVAFDLQPDITMDMGLNEVENRN